MGIYTELIFGAELKRETLEDVVDTLRYLIGDIEKPENALLDMSDSQFGGASYYFAVCEPNQRMWLDDITDSWHISTRSNIKNYQNQIKKFLDWVKPWIEQGSGFNDMYAIVMYEESEEPTIYYLGDK